MDKHRKTYTFVRLLPLLLVFFSLDTVWAEQKKLFVLPNRNVYINIISSIDDNNLFDPHGYEAGYITKFFTEKIVVENISDEILENLSLIINERNYETIDDIKKVIDKYEENDSYIYKVFKFWKNNIFHATSNMDLNRNPFFALNYWGYTICGDNTLALSQLFALMDIKSRRVPLNGHIAAEFFANEKWSVIDGDQKTIYFLLDNHTLASYADIKADPFIALRTKPYGRYGAYDVKQAWKNASLFEFVRNKNMMIPNIRKEGIQDLNWVKWSLYPGEKLIFYPSRTPEFAIGRSDIEAWNNARAFGLGVIEMVVDGYRRQERKSKQNKISIVSKYPIYKIIHHGTGDQYIVPKGEAVFEYQMPSPTRLSLFCQVAKRAMPLLTSGKNKILLRTSDGKGKALVTLVFKPVKQQDTLPKVRTTNLPNTFRYEAPRFVLEKPEKRIDLLWWQISAYDDFRVVIPNFDRIQNFSAIVTLEKISETFLNENKRYYFRIKGKRNGIWGEWSNTYSFSVIKPRPPTNVEYEILEDNRIIIQFNNVSQLNSINMVFGSNRMDFIPDIYSDIEVETILNNKYTTRQNKNQLDSTSENFFILPNNYHFYRIIRKRGQVYSNPSRLIKVERPAHMSDFTLPAPSVLQMRWSKREDAESKLGYRDLYKATVQDIKF